MANWITPNLVLKWNPVTKPVAPFTWEISQKKANIRYQKSGRDGTSDGVNDGKSDRLISVESGLGEVGSQQIEKRLLRIEGKNSNHLSCARSASCQSTFTVVVKAIDGFLSLDGFSQINGHSIEARTVLPVGFVKQSITNRISSDGFLLFDLTRLAASITRVTSDPKKKIVNEKVMNKLTVLHCSKPSIWGNI